MLYILLGLLFVGIAFLPLLLSASPYEQLEEVYWKRWVKQREIELAVDLTNALISDWLSSSWASSR